MKKSLGMRIVEIRRRKGITQISLARDVGVTKSMLSKYENDINDPKSDIVKKLADSLGVSADYLLSRTEFETFKEEDMCVHLDKDELVMLEKYRRLIKDEKIRIDERLEYFLEMKKKSKGTAK